MKKILLGSTVLVGAAALFAGAAFAAETPKVTLGGISNLEAGYASETKSLGLANTASQPSAIRTDNVISFNVDGKTDAGLTYGGAINLEADSSNNADTAGVNAERTYVYVGGAWGKVQGGSDLGVAKTLKVDASSIARATGGVDGDFTYFLTTPASGSTTDVIATPDLFLDYGTGVTGDESTQNLNKVSYYTPRFAGVQAGVSYVSNSKPANRGQLSTGTRLGHAAGEAKNIVIGALNYEGKAGAIGYSAAATGEYGSSQDAATNDLRTYQVGAKVTYMGFAVAGSYADLGDSLRTKATASDSDNSFYTVGASYETGPFGASVTYLSSKKDTVAGTAKNKFSNLSFGTDYKLAPGLTPYAEVSIIDYNPTAIANDNKATVAIVGTQLSF